MKILKTIGEAYLTNHLHIQCLDLRTLLIVPAVVVIRPLTNQAI